MNTISVSYTLKWQVKFAPEYKWTSCKRLFNAKTGREIKKTICGGSIGYWIRREFFTLKELSKKVELIPKTKNPFLTSTS